MTRKEQKGVKDKREWNIYDGVSILDATNIIHLIKEYSNEASTRIT